MHKKLFAGIGTDHFHGLVEKSDNLWRPCICKTFTADSSDVKTKSDLKAVGRIQYSIAVSVTYLDFDSIDNLHLSNKLLRQT